MEAEEGILSDIDVDIIKEIAFESEEHHESYNNLVHSGLIKRPISGYLEAIRNGYSQDLEEYDVIREIAFELREFELTLEKVIVGEIEVREHIKNLKNLLKEL